MKECGECTLCCKLLETHDIPSEIGVYCRHCKNGCSIYDERPEECRTYQCMWSQMETVADELRPDKCGIIFDRISDDVITARIEEGKKINDLLMAQIEYFKNEGFSVMVFRGRDKKLFMNNSHSEPYVLEAIRDCA